MLRKFFTLIMAALIAAAIMPASAATYSSLKVYLNPGHGSWGPNDRPAATIPYPNLSSTGRPDTCGFYESNTNLWKIERLRKALLSKGCTKANVIQSRYANGPYPYVSGASNQYQYNKQLTTICTEVNSFAPDMFISIHSNAATDGTTTNYPLILYRGTDGSGGDKVSGSRNMALTTWTYIYPNDVDIWTSSYSLTNKNVRGDISFYNSSSTTGYLGALKHNYPGFLAEGHFHTYQPQRHRDLNKDYCGMEGIRFFRGLAAYFGLAGETTGYIVGSVKDNSKALSHSLYNYNTKSGSIDAYYPINGATVQLYQGSTLVKTYTTDNNYNGIFVFENIAAGSYTVKVIASGYENLTSGTLTVTANNTTYTNLRLTPGTSTPDPTPDTPDPVVTGNSSIELAWKSTAVPAAADNRQGFGKDNKFYIQNKADHKIYEYNRSGATGVSYTSGAGTNFTHDQAGNMIVRTDGFATTTATSYGVRLISADGSTIKDITITNIPAGRCDFFGMASGDVFSDNGGKLYLAINGVATPYVCSIVNGEFAEGTNASVSGMTVTTSTNTSTSVIDAFINASGDYKAIYAPRTVFPAMLTFSGSAFTASSMSLDKWESCNGSAPFTLGGKDFVAYPYDSNGTTARAAGHYYDGFAIAEIGANNTYTTVAIKEATVSTAANSFQANWLSVEPVSSTQANIYQYYPGGYMAKYVFNYGTATGGSSGSTNEGEGGGGTITVSANTSGGTSEQIGIYAYDLSSTRNSDGSYTFSFKANNAATAAEMNFYDATSGAFAGKVTINNVKKGSNSFTIANEDLPINGGQTVIWKVTLTGADITSHTRVNTASANQYTVACVAIDNNPYSNYFGRAYVDNRGTANWNAACGFYLYDPLFTKTATKYTAGQTTGSSGDGAWGSPLRMGVGPDGTLYISDWADAHSGAWRVNPANPAAAATQFFGGTRASSGLFSNGSTKIGGSTTSIKVVGTGSATKLWVYDEDYSGASNSYTVSCFNVGTSYGYSGGQWTSAPNIHVQSGTQDVNGKTVSLVNIGDLAPDPNGGCWVSCRIVSSTLNNPALIHISASGAIDWNNGTGTNGTSTTNLGGTENGALAISPDGTLLAIQSGGTTSPDVALYTVTWSNGTPRLTLRNTWSCSAVQTGSSTSLSSYFRTTVTGLAFDYGNNLWVTGSDVGVWPCPTGSGYSTWAVNRTTVPAKTSLTVYKDIVETGEISPVTTGSEISIYAYDLVATEDADNNYTFTFKSNNSGIGTLTFTDAGNDNVLGTITLNNVVSGTNTVTVSSANLPGAIDQLMNWSVTVQGRAVTGYQQLRITSESYTRACVAVDDNPASPYFGRMYVSDRVASSNASNGIYAYTTEWSRINSSPYTGGQTFGNNMRFDIGNDGTLFVGDWSDGHSGVWRMNPANLSATAIQLFGGTRATSGLIGSVGGSISGLRVVGTGASTKLWAVDEDLNSGKSTITTYNIGNNYNFSGGTWSAAPSRAIALTESTAGASTPGMAANAGDVAVMSDGSVWVSMSRSPSAGGNTLSYPSLLHFNSSGTLDAYYYYWKGSASNATADPNLIIKDAGGNSETWGCQDGNVAVTHDESLLAMNDGHGNIVIFKIGDDKKSLTQKAIIACAAKDSNNKIWSLSFDYAGNLIASGTKVAMYSMPDRVNRRTTPANSTVVRRAPMRTTVQLASGTTGRVRISNQMVCAAISPDGTKLYAKDLGLYASPDANTGNLVDYIALANLGNGTYDQSNWVEITLPTPLTTSTQIAAYLNHVITGVDGTASTVNGNIYINAVSMPTAGSASTFTPNNYIATNFVSNHTGAIDGKTYFFVTPKPCEYAMLNWVIYDADLNAFIVPTRGYYGDHMVNNAGLTGTVTVNASLVSSGAFTDGAFYEQVPVIVKRVASGSSAPARNGAPQRAAGDNFVIYPLEVPTAGNIYTDVEDIRTEATKEVTAVRYFDLSGREVPEPVAGAVTIEVTFYNDGSKSSRKIR